MERLDKVYFTDNKRGVYIGAECYLIPEDLRGRIEKELDACLNSITEILEESPLSAAVNEQQDVSKISSDSPIEFKQNKAAEAQCSEKADDKMWIFSDAFPGSRQYKYTTSGHTKTRTIMNYMALSKIILHHLSINEPFRLTIEYEPEELNARFMIESDHACPEDLRI